MYIIFIAELTKVIALPEERECLEVQQQTSIERIHLSSVGREGAESSGQANTAQCPITGSHRPRTRTRTSCPCLEHVVHVVLNHREQSHR